MTTSRKTPPDPKSPSKVSEDNPPLAEDGKQSTGLKGVLYSTGIVFVLGCFGRIFLGAPAQKEAVVAGTSRLHAGRDRTSGRQWLWFGARCFLYYAGVVLVLAFFQRSLMYPSTQMERITPQNSHLPMGQVHDISIQTEDGLTLHGWHILPWGQTAVDSAGCDKILELGDPVVLFFHGNGGNRIHRDDEYQLFSRFKCHIVTFDYRGYGENPGAPSETKLAADAQSAWKYLTDTRKLAPSRIILFGESLGGGIATRLAAEACDAKEPPRGLILRSTFSSMVDAAGYNYPWLPVRLVLIDRYLSIQQIPRVTCPILMLHGKQDTIVPFVLGKRLFEAAPEQSLSGIPKSFVELPHSNHNDFLVMDEQLVRNSLAAFLKGLK